MPKRVLPLTDLQIRNAAPRDKPYSLTDGGGLVLEIMPTGSKIWRMKFTQLSGGSNRLTFGPYPVVTLLGAREKRLETQRLIRDGVDPAKHRDDKKRISVEKASNTFEKVAREWHSNKVPTWSERTATNTQIALRLMMLIFVRTSELIETPWSEIDLEKGEWIIPWQRMKRGKLTVNPDTTDHHVCLSRQALALLRELHAITGRGTYLFPNQRDHSKPLSNNAILKSLERMGYKGKMTGHGFRALAMSAIKERLGYPGSKAAARAVLIDAAATKGYAVKLKASKPAATRPRLNLNASAAFAHLKGGTWRGDRPSSLACPGRSGR